MKRPPDEIIGPADNPYMLRWWIIRPPKPLRRFLPVLYVHRILRSDAGRDLHDHVGWNVSLVIKGMYKEHLKSVIRFRGEGSLIFRRATTLHRIELLTPGWLFDRSRYGESVEPVTTLWLRGPYRRKWGFLTKDGWVPHDEYDGEA